MTSILDFEEWARQVCKDKCYPLDMVLARRAGRGDRVVMHLWIPDERSWIDRVVKRVPDPGAGASLDVLNYVNDSQKIVCLVNNEQTVGVEVHRVWGRYD